jgi:hypothetical protein
MISPNGVPVSYHDKTMGPIEKAPLPKLQMVAGFQQLPPLVPSMIISDDILIHNVVLSRSSIQEGNNAQAWEEDRSILPQHSHDDYEAIYEPCFRNDIQTRGGKNHSADEKNPQHDKEEATTIYNHPTSHD